MTDDREYHVKNITKNTLVRVHLLKDARKKIKLLHKKYPNDILELAGPWWPFHINWSNTRCVCSDRKGARKMDKPKKGSRSHG